MFREGEVPPEVAAEYEKMKGEKNMEKPKLEVVGSAEDKEIDIGSLQAGIMEAEDFVKAVLAREGGDSKRIDMAAHSVKEFWLKQLDEGALSPEEFGKGIYDAVKKMLGQAEKPSAKEKEREKIRKERVKSAIGRRAA